MNKVLALAVAETKLVLRNKTVLISSLVVPLALGAFFATNFGAVADPSTSATVVALQLSVVFGMGIYVTATQTVVARRHSRVLKRMRTSGISDGGLLVATIAPSVALAVIQLLIFGVIDVVIGTAALTDPVALVVALVGGVALTVTAALATTIVTASPERAQITTLPLVFVLLIAAIVLVVVPEDGWWQALVLVPGAVIGQLTEFAFVGGTWAAGLGGLPAVLPTLVAMVVWPVVFAAVAVRRFRWDPRT